MRFLTLFALGAIVPAQTLVNINDGNVAFSYSSYPTATNSAAGYGNFSAGGSDHLYQCWWYYSVSGDATGAAFNSSNGQLVVTPGADGRSATLDWANVDNRGFAARLVECVYSTGASTGVCAQTMAITNNTGQPLAISVYCYTDFDVSQTSGGDSAQQVAGGATGQQAVTDGTTNVTAYFLAEGFTRWEVAGFAGLRTNIINGVGGGGYNLNNGGMPFGPGDYTGGYQWSLALAPSQTAHLPILLADGFLPPSPNPAAAVPYGQAKAGTPGFPSWGTARPFAGSQANLEIRNGLPGAAPLMLVGATQINLPFPPFGTVYVNPVVTFGMPPFSAAGVSSVPIPVPLLRQGGAHFQAIWADPAANGGLVHTEGLTWAVGSYY